MTRDDAVDGTGSAADTGSGDGSEAAADADGNDGAVDSSFDLAVPEMETDVIEIW